MKGSTTHYTLMYPFLGEKVSLPSQHKFGPYFQYPQQYFQAVPLERGKKGTNILVNKWKIINI